MEKKIRMFTNSYQAQLLLAALVLLFTSCGVSKYIPEGEMLLADTNVEIEGDISKKEKKQLESELTDLIRPEVNSTFLGTRLGVRWHYRANSEKSNFMNRFLDRRFGEEAVLLSQLNPERNMDILLNRLENKGYFIAEADYSIDTTGKKKAAVNFLLMPEEPYTLQNYIFEGESGKLPGLIRESMSSTLLEKGRNYDLSTLREERERISQLLQEKGYYYFIADHLIFSVDTTVGERQFDLFLQLKREMPNEARIPYRIGSITVFPDYGVENEDGTQRDTIEMERFTVITGNSNFLPRRFDNFIQLEKGEYFSKTLSDRTRQRLFSMGAFGFVNIRHSIVNRNIDSLAEEGTLHTSIYLSPLTKRSLRAELQLVSKSNNFMGPLMTAELVNRNLLKGGEKLNIGFRVGYETQVAGGRQTGLSALETGLSAELVFPRIIAPFRWRDNVAYGVPKTHIAVSYSMLNRVKNYQLFSTQIDYGYSWNGSRYAHHEIKPVALTFTRLTNTSEAFENILKNNPFLGRSFEQQFIPGTQYAFTYNDLGRRGQRINRLILFRADIAGNLAHLIDGWVREERTNTLFGRNFAHYLRFDFDVRHYYHLGEEKKVVARVFAGWGMPLSNSLSLPYIKQYFSGGPNSIRAFRIRSLGPGIYRPEEIDQSSFFDQAGDIRVELNLEYRFPLFSYLKGAFFVDAGNIWLYNDNESLPGGKFSSDWMKELAAGAGFGLRLDLDLFIIRLDWATPLRKPWLEEGDRWVSSFQPGRKDWRRENLIWNIAIGYPF